MEAVQFWHGQFVGVSTNSFKYWRGWVSEVDDAWHFYYQFGRMSNYPDAAGSIRVGCKRTGSKSLALSVLQDKVYSKSRKGYVGRWYYSGLAGWDFPLDVPGKDWELSVTQAQVIVARAKVKRPVQAAVQSDDVSTKRRSPLDIGWRLDLS